VTAPPPPPDFSLYPREQLWAMLFAGDPKVVREMAAQWSDIATAFYSRTGDLERQLRDLERHWSGDAAGRYRMMIKGLIDGLQATADVARLTADRIYSAAEALESMQAWAISNMKSGPALTLVLTRLARRYQNLMMAIPHPPQTAAVPTAVDVLSGTYRNQPPPPAPPLFDGLYRNGIESAAAALGGNFEQAVPTFAAPGPSVLNGTPVIQQPPVEVKPPVVEPPALDRPAVGRASVDIPSFGPITTFPDPPASASVPVTPPNPAAVAAASPMIPPMMPPMIPPMMGMAGMGMGMGAMGGGMPGQSAQWLQEDKRDLVFGVPLSYTRWAVIGEPEKENEPPREDSWGFD
jgi:uncharacterized protein YukE